MVKTTGGDKQLHMVHDIPVHEAPDDTHERGEEAQRGRMPRPVLPRGCSLTQFTSFQHAWNNFSEQYKSRHIDESQHKINYQLN